MKIYHFCKSYIGLIILTLILSIISVIASFLWNIRVADLIDSVCEGHSISLYMTVQTALYILFVIISEGLLALISSYTGEKISEQLRDSFALQIQGQKSTHLAEMNAGVQISKLLNEVNEISEYITENLFPLLSDFIKCIVTFILLIRLNTTLTCFSNLPVLIIILYTAFTSKVLGSLALQSQKARQETNGIVNTILELFPVMKLYHAESVLLKSYTEVTLKWVEVSSKEEKGRSFLMSLSAILSCIPILMLVLVGGSMVLHGEISIGILYLFINMSANITGFLMNMPGFIGTFRRFCSNFKSLAIK